MPMRTPVRAHWRVTALLAGALYTVVGVAFGMFAGAAATEPLRLAWRWSAFVVSGFVFIAHVAHEQLRLRSPARSLAGHAAGGAALGGLGLALAANLHELASATGYRPRLLIALFAWPALTAVPAFVIALLLATLLGRERRTR